MVNFENSSQTYRLAAEQVEFMRLCIEDKFEAGKPWGEKPSSHLELEKDLAKQVEQASALKGAELPIGLTPYNCDFLLECMPETTEEAEEMTARTLKLAHEQKDADIDLIGMSSFELENLAKTKYVYAQFLLHTAAPIKLILTN
ncbi:MAG: hypothetical protein QFB86_03820 [Patescibacteria group bacterium]|nr:hypothetical protein [Patescibacteria group bacterium]